MKEYFYTQEEAEYFYEKYSNEIEEHILIHGSSHFIGMFTSYINNRSNTEDDVFSIHSDMAKMVWDLYYIEKSRKK